MHSRESLRYSNNNLFKYITIYYCKQKNITVWVDCYQDYLLSEKVDRIETAKSVQQVLNKVEIWLKIMNEYKDKYNIERLHPHYDTEIRDYEDKLNELSIKLTRAKEINNFVQYSEIIEGGYKLLKELFGSYAMTNFKDHVTLNYFSSKTNEVSQTLNKIWIITTLRAFILFIILVIKYSSYILIDLYIELNKDWRSSSDRTQIWYTEQDEGRLDERTPRQI